MPPDKGKVNLMLEPTSVIVMAIAALMVTALVVLFLSYATGGGPEA